MKFLTYAAPAIHNAMMDMVRDAFTEILADMYRLVCILAENFIFREFFPIFGKLRQKSAHATDDGNMGAFFMSG